ncbi:hypothetical protein F8388_003445 [Cannabis sativa]|uniref:BHLH domain-containing protein n=1 Tax=Cannabis sativa TaxID=3483 RepID=A0A7J6F582_CANSA|nr:hypothetical protein F8388_003445 [Cannabis sativa]
MDVFFSEEFFSGDALWYSEANITTTPMIPSAFEVYREEPKKGSFMQTSWINSDNKMNLNKRMIDLLRRRRSSSSSSKYNISHVDHEHEKERCYRHMINERIRREKQKQSYFTLHSMLPVGTKNDKNSIVQIATMKIQELETYKEELKREQMKLKEALMERNININNKNKNNKIKVRVAKPINSGVDLMVEVLNCLKRLGLRAINIRSHFSSDEFYAELDIQTEDRVQGWGPVPRSGPGPSQGQGWVRVQDGSGSGSGAGDKVRGLGSGLGLGSISGSKFVTGTDPLPRPGLGLGPRSGIEFTVRGRGRGVGPSLGLGFGV